MAEWIPIDLIDQGSPDFICENCNKENIRYKHILENLDSGKIIAVGCVCAGHLTQDFTSPKLRERDLKSRSDRRMRFPTLSWVRSRKGNLRLKKDGMVFVLHIGSFGYGISYLLRAESKWVSVPGWYATPEAAKLAGFDAAYPA